MTTPTKSPLTSPLHILIISSDFDYRTTIIHRLSKKEHIATGAQDNVEALKIFSDKSLCPVPIDIIFISEPDGHDLAEALYAKLINIELAKTPIIATLNQRSFRIQRGSINDIHGFNLKKLVDEIR
jgi:DNA-binding NtrC family response regulator